MALKTQWLKGVFPALVTPFTKEGELDEAALRKLVRFCLPHVDGFVPCGTTGEFVYMSPDERQRVLEVVLDEVGGAKPVIAGTGAAGTREAIELASAAKEAGASACLVVTPYFLHPSDKGVYQHFYEIAKAVDIPIILYNIPQAVDRYLPREVIEDLADIPNIVGLKDSSGNLTYTMEVLEFAGDRINVLVGHDEVVLPALAGGASGMILASAQVFPEIWQRVYKAVQEGDLEMIAQRLDFLGLNYYWEDAAVYDAGAPEKFRFVKTPYVESAMGWDVIPSGLYRQLVWVDRNYGHPTIYVTENGFAADDLLSEEGTRCHDQHRIDYLRGHFRACSRAIETGVDLKGYFLWSLIDNFEWAHGFTKRFGIVYCDYTDGRRVIKDSGYYYREVIAGYEPG